MCEKYINPSIKYMKNWCGQTYIWSRETAQWVQILATKLNYLPELDPLGPHGRRSPIPKTPLTSICALWPVCRHPHIHGHMYTKQTLNK